MFNKYSKGSENVIFICKVDIVFDLWIVNLKPKLFQIWLFI